VATHVTELAEALDADDVEVTMAGSAPNARP
jgi:hypothetical protein